MSNKSRNCTTLSTTENILNKTLLTSSRLILTAKKIRAYCQSTFKAIYYHVI